MYSPTIKLDPVQQQYQRKYWRKRIICLLILLAVAVYVYWAIFAQVPVDYASDEEHFKYGSIGADTSGGVPYWIWQVLPEMFPRYLPDGKAFTSLPAPRPDELLATDKRTALAAYSQFGFIVEEGKELPIGFSKRRDLMDRVGLNCAVCHVGTVKKTTDMDPDKIYGSKPDYVTSKQDRVIILGMPANSVELIRYFKFLFACAADGRFTTDNIMAHIDAKTKLGPIDRFFYRQAIPVVREFLLLRKRQLEYAYVNDPDGPGRVDTFNPYKSIVFGFPMDHTRGTSDFPSIWNQRPRELMHLHWDGNNTSVFERNISASLGAGATPVSLDMPRMLRTAYWIGGSDPRQPPDLNEVMQERQNPVPRENEMQIPRFPFWIDTELAATGKQIYAEHCASCHDFTSQQVGEVVPYKDIRTDKYRLDSYTQALSDNQNTIGAGKWWRFRKFRKTNGYANSPLDGIWARAPYLHNGSVPTLRDLLNSPSERPAVFYRGDDEYDPVNVGFRSDRSENGEGKKLFRFDTTIPGNGNGGHYYGTDLTDDQKAALVEYMKNL